MMCLSTTALQGYWRCYVFDKYVGLLTYLTVHIQWNGMLIFQRNADAINCSRQVTNCYTICNSYSVKFITDNNCGGVFKVGKCEAIIFIQMSVPLISAQTKVLCLSTPIGYSFADTTNVKYFRLYLFVPPCLNIIATLNNMMAI